MKNTIKFSLFLSMVAVFSLLTSCGGGGGSYWDGDASSAEEKLAKQGCECMYNTLKDAGIAVDKLLGKTEDDLKKDEALKAELEKMDGIKMADIACMKTFRDDMIKGRTDKTIDGDKFDTAMETKCKLGKLK